MSPTPEVYQVFFNSAGDAIFIVDAVTRTVVEANGRAMDLTGYRREELVGLSIERLFRPSRGMELPSPFRNPTDSSLASRDRLNVVMKHGGSTEVGVTASRAEWNRTTLLIVIAREVGAGPSCVKPAGEGGTVWPEDEHFPAIIGRSEKILDTCRLIGSVAKSDLTVLTQGESGTGKEVIAHAIHFHSHRARGPFVKVNCAALTETLLESELFGHVKGAFTGAIRDRQGRFKQADGGTLLLDEIGSMSLSGQAKLLRVLQEREFEPVGSSVTTKANVRVIATTNTSLEKAVAASKFREDLYYRLSVFSISLPPLRERKEDIPLLAEHFLHKYTRAVGKGIRALAPDALALMMEHNWPGNVRELENALEYAVIVEKGPVVVPSSLPRSLTESHGPNGGPERQAELGLRDKLNALEKQILLDTLVLTKWTKKRAAAVLRIDARNLSYFLRKHNLAQSVRPN